MSHEVLQSISIILTGLGVIFFSVAFLIHLFYFHRSK